LARRIKRLVVATGCIVALLALAYGGLFYYLEWRESVSPSTDRVLVLQDGRRISLVQPTAQPAPSTLGNVDGASGTGSAEQGGGTFLQAPGRALSQTGTEAATTVPRPAPIAGGGGRSSGAEIPPAPDAYLPPLRVSIPSIGVDRPVVLGTNEHMPRFRGVGWLLGSAYPGRPGNIVLFGHVDGPNATFERLHELKLGAEFTISTESGPLRYRVRSIFETTPDDVSVLAPTDTPTATLITCGGFFDKANQSYAKRVIVTADYLGK
jgi:LPXTG-site transpeptidase (sortase) family protein